MQTAEEKLAIIKNKVVKKVGLTIQADGNEETNSVFQLYRRALRIMKAEPMITSIKYEVIFHYDENPMDEKRGWLTMHANADVELDEKSYWEW